VGTCSPTATWSKTKCSGSSSRARPGPGSWGSAATCAPSTRPVPRSRSSVTTSHLTWPPQSQARGQPSSRLSGSLLRPGRCSPGEGQKPGVGVQRWVWLKQSV